jgi:CheY-like chemotaxis protein
MELKTTLDGHGALGNKRVLVVEDEAIVAMLIEDELHDAGAKVLGPAGSVEDALAVIAAAGADGGLDVAVLDIELDGEAVTPVADRLATLGVPFIFATGYAEPCDTGGHPAPVLHKPFDLHDLILALGALVRPGAN